MSAQISLKGRKALVTGGASGIGAATARLFLDLGADVVISDIDAAKLEPARGEIGAKGAVAGDVADEAGAERMVSETVRLLGDIDIVMNSAGIGDEFSPTVEKDLESWQRVVDVNLRGTFLVCRAAGRHMVAAKRGAIVNVSSIVGLGAFPRRTAYGPAKAAVAHLTRTLACEWGDLGIRVNAIAPGYIVTPMVEDLLERKVFPAERVEARTPLARLGRPEEIAQAAAFLVSDWASYITGAVLPVDGGWGAFGGHGPVAGG